MVVTVNTRLFFILVCCVIIDLATSSALDRVVMHDMDTTRKTSLEYHKNISVMELPLSKNVVRTRLKREADSPSENTVGDITQLSVGQTVLYALICLAVVVCTSTTVLMMYIFCDRCDDRSSTCSADGPYVGKINLADIQVIYNPAAGAARLPYSATAGATKYSHTNEAFKQSRESLTFKQSHESLVLENPAVLAIPTTVENEKKRTAQTVDNQPPPRSSKLDSGAVYENQATKHSVPPKSRGHLNDVYVEYGRIFLAFEIPSVMDSEDGVALTSSNAVMTSSNISNKNNMQTSNQNNIKASVSHIKRTNELKSTNIKLGAGNASQNTGKEYDMNDVAYKNMHARY